MADRKPFDARKLQLCYNSVHLLINAYLFYEACVCGWLTGYSFRCQSVDFSQTGIPMRVFFKKLFAQLKGSEGILLFQAARGCWLYYLSKFTDFFETITFVLLKRFDMVNLYHVAHHSIMPVSVWWGVKFLPGKENLPLKFWAFSIKFQFNRRWTFNIFRFHKHSCSHRNLHIFSSHHNCTESTKIFFLVESFLPVLSSMKL